MWLNIAQVITFCLTASSHNLNQFWLVINWFLCHSPTGTENIHDNFIKMHLKTTHLKQNPHPTGDQRVNSRSSEIFRDISSVHICVNEPGHTRFTWQFFAYSTSSHYLNWCWPIISVTHENQDIGQSSIGIQMHSFRNRTKEKKTCQIYGEYMWYIYIVRSRNIGVHFLQITRERHPWPFVSSKSDRSFTFEFIVLCAVSCYISPQIINNL